MRLYLDACCLGRPFDNQLIDRNRAEAEAVLTIMQRIREGRDTMFSSDVLILEISKTPQSERKAQAYAWLSLAESSLVSGDREDERASALSRLGFKSFDALHIACAETLESDILLTTDDRVLRAATRHKDQLNVRVLAPIQYLLEVFSDDNARNELE